MASREEIAAKVAEELGIGLIKDATEWSGILWEALIDAKVMYEGAERDYASALTEINELSGKLADAKVELAEREQPATVETRFAEFDDAEHPFRKWWEEHGQYMMSGGGRRESIWAARGWIAREQLLLGNDVTGDSMHESRDDSELRVKKLSEALRGLVTDPVVSGQSAHIRDTARHDGRIIDPYERARAVLSEG